MTNDPSAVPRAADPSAPAAGPPCWLLVMCVQCGQGVEAPLPIDREMLSRLLVQHGWFISVLTPPEQKPETPIGLGAICPGCAQQIFPPEILRAAEERRQQMVQASQRAR